jgi:molybdate-binding protein
LDDESVRGVVYADAGFGVHAAAQHFELDFVPLAWERYFLFCDRRTLAYPAAAGPAVQ